MLDGGGLLRSWVKLLFLRFLGLELPSLQADPTAYPPDPVPLIEVLLLRLAGLLGEPTLNSLRTTLRCTLAEEDSPEDEDVHWSSSLSATTVFAWLEDGCFLLVVVDGDPAPPPPFMAATR